MTIPSDSPLTIYRFADLTLDTTRRCVLRRGRPIELRSLDFDLLRFLVESAPNVVNADALAEKVWGRHFVSPENVAQRIKLLRQSLADDANQPHYIETVRNKGYRLIPVVDSGTVTANAGEHERRRLAPVVAVLLSIAALAAAGSYWLGEMARRPPPSPTSIAVLPFENLNLNDDVFAAGMRDEIVSQLTKVGGLRVFPVTPGTAVRRPLADIARDLEIATVLGGSVHYAEGRVRVNTHLTVAETNETLWSDSYQRDLDDVFAIQGEIAVAVARALSVELSVSERRRVEQVPTADARARDLYLRARARHARDTRATHANKRCWRSRSSSKRSQSIHCSRRHGSMTPTCAGWLSTTIRSAATSIGHGARRPRAAQ